MFIDSCRIGKILRSTSSLIFDDSRRTIWCDSKRLTLFHFRLNSFSLASALSISRIFATIFKRLAAIFRKFSCFNDVNAKSTHPNLTLVIVYDVFNETGFNTFRILIESCGCGIERVRCELCQSDCKVLLLLLLLWFGSYTGFFSFFFLDSLAFIT